MIKSKLPNVSTTIFSVMSQLANEHQAINLAQGFPDFNADSELISRLNYYSTQNYNQYAPMTGVEKLRVLLSEKYSKSVKELLIYCRIIQYSIILLLKPYFKERQYYIL